MLDSTLFSVTSLESVAWIAFFFLVAWLVHRLSGRLAGRLVLIQPLASRQSRPERQQTLQGLIRSIITFAAFTLAILFSLSLFVDTDTLIWMVGLFSAAFGLGARPLVSDFLSGLGFLFEDTFYVSEKIQLPGLAAGAVEGVVEAVNLRTTQVRSASGELFTVPNGEIRVVRNFSRGLFSTTDIHLKMDAHELDRALVLLASLVEEGMIRLPNLIEPWQVINQSGEIGQYTELTVIAKARFGLAAEMRPRLLSLVQEAFDRAGIGLV